MAGDASRELKRINAQVSAPIAESVVAFADESEHGAMQQISTLGYGLVMGLRSDLRVELMGWLASMKTRRQMHLVTERAVWRKLSELVADDPQAKHFIDRIIDPAMLAHKEDTPEAAPKPSGGRPSGRRAAS